MVSCGFGCALSWFRLGGSLAVVHLRWNCGDEGEHRMCLLGTGDVGSQYKGVPDVPPKLSKNACLTSQALKCKIVTPEWPLEAGGVTGSGWGFHGLIDRLWVRSANRCLLWCRSCSFPTGPVFKPLLLQSVVSWDGILWLPLCCQLLHGQLKIGVHGRFGLCAKCTGWIGLRAKCTETNAQKCQKECL